jgi:hypothetical protein
VKDHQSSPEANRQKLMPGDYASSRNGKTSKRLSVCFVNRANGLLGEFVSTSTQIETITQGNFSGIINESK